MWTDHTLSSLPGPRGGSGRTGWHPTPKKVTKTRSSTNEPQEGPQDASHSALSTAACGTGRGAHLGACSHGPLLRDTPVGGFRRLHRPVCGLASPLGPRLPDEGAEPRGAGARPHRGTRRPVSLQQMCTRRPPERATRRPHLAPVSDKQEEPVTPDTLKVKTSHVTPHGGEGTGFLPAPTAPALTSLPAVPPRR